MYNQNASAEEKEFYKMLLAEAQNVGNQYLQTCMNPATNQINNFNKWEKGTVQGRLLYFRLG